MVNCILYVLSVLVWGTTWFAIKLQVTSEVAPPVSVGYRFCLAAIILIPLCLLLKKKMQFTLKEHLYMGFQGIMQFGLSFYLAYWGTQNMKSGFAAVAFSTIVIMNILNGAIFYRLPVRANVVVGAVLGFLGVLTIFWPDIKTFDCASKCFIGFGYVMFGTLMASVGNILSARNQKKGIPVLQNNAYGMLYAGLFVLGLSLMRGHGLNFDMSVNYTGSLVYLSVIGSIVGFGCYLTLLGRIGADRAAYAIVLTPIVALTLSTLLEGFEWNDYTIGGCMIVLFGNVLVLWPRKLKRVASINTEKSIEAVS